ncbi:L-asparaginase [Citrobacter portucalensis]|nr:L-asparaginase [Citrobacter freundii]AVD76376.1 L-asparaginase [Citrobacter freundii]AWV27962.1 L-asparaginase [Citrobacter youngae]RHH51548.1 L-asparaginase [Citrobacter portucalensis]
MSRGVKLPGSNRAILFAILNAGSARNPHVLHVRSGSCALAESKLPSPITPC